MSATLARLRGVAGGFRSGCTLPRAAIFDQVNTERWRQLEKWGEQSHPDMWEESPQGLAFSRSQFVLFAERYRAVNDYAAEASDGSLDWAGILLEEIYEALAEEDPTKLREELIQSAAVITAWIEDIDSRGN